MRIETTFIHLEGTEALEGRIRERSGRLSKWVPDKAVVRWNCRAKGKDHHAEARITGLGDDLSAKASSDSLYKSIDLAVAKLEKQLERRKEKRKNKIHTATKITAVAKGTAKAPKGRD